MGKFKFCIVTIFLIFFEVSFAQQANTLYFMRNVPQRNVLNPAFQPIQNIYIDLPVFPDFVTSVGNNAVSFNDMLTVKDINGSEELINFLSQDFNSNEFLSKLQKHNYFHADFGINLLNFGFRVKKNYFTFGITQRFISEFMLSKDMFNLAINGTDDISTLQATYDLDKLGISLMSFTEFAAGYSCKINDKLTIGGKFKYLIGQDNITTSIDEFRINAGLTGFSFEGNGDIHISVPGMEVPIDENGNINSDDINTDELNDYSWNDFIFTKNWGLGMDLGFTYNPIKHLQLSAAITDLGFINWNEGTTNASISEKVFDGFNYDGTEDWKDKLDSVKGLFEKAFTKEADHDSYATYLHTHVNVGAEYGLWNDKLTVGLLSSTLFGYKTTEEGTFSLNFVPCKFFSATASYTLTDGEYNTLGAGMQVHAYPFNFYIAIDHIPFEYSKDYIPTDLKSTSLQIGCGLAFGNVLNRKHKNIDSIENLLPEKVDTIKKDTVIKPMASKIDTTPHMSISVPIQRGLEGIHFLSGKYDIPVFSYSILNQLVFLMNKHKEYSVALIGYTDKKEAIGKEKELSMKRANSVKAYLLKKGIKESRISCVANGSENPLVEGSSGKDLIRNRRVEFDIR